MNDEREETHDEYLARQDEYTIRDLTQRLNLADSLITALLVLRRTGEEKDRAAFEEMLAKYVAPLSIGEAMARAGGDPEAIRLWEQTHKEKT